MRHLLLSVSTKGALIDYIRFQHLYASLIWILDCSVYHNKSEMHTDRQFLSGSNDSRTLYSERERAVKMSSLRFAVSPNGKSVVLAENLSFLPEYETPGCVCKV